MTYSRVFSVIKADIGKPQRNKHCFYQSSFLFKKQKSNLSNISCMKYAYTHIVSVFSLPLKLINTILKLTINFQSCNAMSCNSNVNAMILNLKEEIHLLLGKLKKRNQCILQAFDVSTFGLARLTVSFLIPILENNVL